MFDMLLLNTKNASPLVFIGEKIPLTPDSFPLLCGPIMHKLSGINGCKRFSDSENREGLKLH